MVAAERFLTSLLWNYLVYEVTTNFPKKATIIAQFVYKYQSNITNWKVELKNSITIKIKL